MSSTFSSRTSSNQAVPVALPLRPRCNCTASLGLVAKNSTDTRSPPAPATVLELLVKGKLAMDTQAPRAVG